jgi:hypothetical protein
MNVSTEDIKNIPAGKMQIFPCEDGRKVRSARSLLSIIKETGSYPDGVVDYEGKKFELETGLVFAIRALRDGDTKIFGRNR